jgi:hypothetical protein
MKCMYCNIVLQDENGEREREELFFFILPPPRSKPKANRNGGKHLYFILFYFILICYLFGRARDGAVFYFRNLMFYLLVLNDTRPTDRT